MLQKLKKLSSAPQITTNNQDYFTQNDPIEFDLQWVINDIEVYYHRWLNGGGNSFGTRYPAVINEIYNYHRFKNCFEWCAGPGFIGFNLLSAQICEQLYLADIYPPALLAIDKTVKNLPVKYQDTVHSAHIKGIQDLPKSWKFDLVVSNPPHWNPIDTMFTSMKPDPMNRISVDTGWKIHKEFFSHIGSHLADDAVILLQEHSHASGPEMFKSIIEESGLTITDCYWEEDKDNFYYLEVKQK